MLRHVGASLNVAFCYGVYEQPRCVGIVMELLSGGGLFSRIRSDHYSEAGERPGDSEAVGNTGIRVCCV